MREVQRMEQQGEKALGRRQFCACAALLAGQTLLAGCGAVQRQEEALAAAPGDAERLTVYTSHKEAVYGPILREFEERTGIWVEAVTGGTNELLERIEAEQAAPVCDVMFGGGAESLLAYAGCFEPYQDDTVELKSGLQAPGQLWAPFSCLPIVLVYNRKLVGAGAVRGWADLVDPAWKGRIAFADPAVSGSSYTAAMTMLACLPGDLWENQAAFYANVAGNILQDSGDVTPAVASGRLPVGICLEETALKAQAQGSELEIVYPAEGTSSLPDGTALIAGAPHRENAVAFLAFTQSEDVQRLVAEQLCRRAVRADVADPASLPATEQMRVIDYDIQWASAYKEEFLRRWAALEAADSGEAEP
jgi:iron(III) transport system substrate-binding protein